LQGEVQLPNRHDVNLRGKPALMVDCHLCSEETGELVLLVSEFEIGGERLRGKERASNVNEDPVVRRHD
jgi:hypothetical protein